MCKAPSLLLETRRDGWILGSHLEQEGAMHWGWHGTSQKPRTLVAVELMAPWAPSQALAWEGNSLPRVSLARGFRLVTAGWEPTSSQCFGRRDCSHPHNTVKETSELTETPASLPPTWDTPPWHVQVYQCRWVLPTETRASPAHGGCAELWESGFQPGLHQMGCRCCGRGRFPSLGEGP